MKRILRIQVTCLFIWMGISGLALAQVPQLMNYQGLLTDPATGEPVADDTYEMVFSIYDVSTGGSAVWTESKSVQTQNGLYSVLLGSTTPLTATVLSGPEKYLGIKVGTDAEMTPRKRIVSTAYAIMSAEAENSWRLTGNSATTAGTNFLGTTDSEPLVFKINGAEAMRVNATGNVGIGTTAPAAPLHVRSTGQPDVIVEETTVGNAVQIALVNTTRSWELGSDSSPDQFTIHDATAGITRLSIDNSGNVGIGTTSPNNPLEMGSGAHVTAGGVWTDASSREYKEDIENLTLDNAIETLENLNPVTFRYKAEKDFHVGFIAEDVPEMVATPDRKSLSSMDIVAVLTKVVQEQQKTISELEARVEALEGNK